MGSPLRPIIAGIFLTSFEGSILPAFVSNMQPWCRYVDDPFTTIHKDAIQQTVGRLNSFHPKIQFTYEVDKKQCLSFLDICIIRNNNGKADTTVFWKQTNQDLYMIWGSFSPKSWRLGTLKALVWRAFKICSTREYRNQEIDMSGKCSAQSMTIQ